MATSVRLIVGLPLADYGGIVAIISRQPGRPATLAALLHEYDLPEAGALIADMGPVEIVRVVVETPPRATETPRAASQGI